MKRTQSYFFLILIHTCCGHSSGFQGRIVRHNFDKDTTMHEKLRNIELVRHKIEKFMGDHGISIPDTTSQPKGPNRSQDPPVRYKIPKVTSYYSEPPDNFTDENILQFRLQAESQQGKRVEVNDVKLLVRIKMNKKKKDRRSKIKRRVLTKEEKQGRRRRRKKLMKEITLVVLKVNADGSPGDQVTRETTKITKTKFLRLTLPKEEIQNAIDSNNKTVQYFVRCIGCDKRVRMITTSKKQRVTRERSSPRKPQLMKRRPMMILMTHIVSWKKI